MNIALLIGKHNSSGVKGKNYMELMGRPLCWYPLSAACSSSKIDKVYVSTDSAVIKEIAKSFSDVSVIDRPGELCLKETPTEDVFSHAWNIIKSNEVDEVESITLMFANSVDVLPCFIDEGIEKLLNEDFDSIVSISKFNMFSPLRARVIDGSITKPMLDIKSMGIENTFDRDALGDCYFIDFGVQVVKPRCLENIKEGALPFMWLGNTIGYIKKEFGFDIDAEWQVPVMEYWLSKNGFTASSTPY